MGSPVLDSRYDWFWILVAGQKAPQVLVDDTRTAAHQFQDLAAAVGETGPQIEALRARVAQALPPDVAEQFSKASRMFSDSMPDLNTGAGQLGESLTKLALDVEKTNYSIIIQVSTFAASAVLALLTPFTAWLVPGIIAAARLVVAQLISRLVTAAMTLARLAVPGITRILQAVEKLRWLGRILAAAGTEAAQEVAQEGLAQGIQIAQGHRALSNIDGNSLAQAAGWGALAGAQIKGLGDLAQTAAHRAGKPGAVNNVAFSAANQALGETTVGIAAALANGMPLDDVWMGTVSGAATATAHHGAHATGQAAAKATGVNAAGTGAGMDSSQLGGFASWEKSPAAGTPVGFGVHSSSGPPASSTAPVDAARVPTGVVLKDPAGAVSGPLGSSGATAQAPHAAPVSSSSTGSAEPPRSVGGAGSAGDGVAAGPGADPIPNSGSQDPTAVQSSSGSGKVPGGSLTTRPANGPQPAPFHGAAAVGVPPATALGSDQSSSPSASAIVDGRINTAARPAAFAGLDLADWLDAVVGTVEAAGALPPAEEETLGRRLGELLAPHAGSLDRLHALHPTVDVSAAVTAMLVVHLSEHPGEDTGTTERVVNDVLTTTRAVLAKPLRLRGGAPAGARGRKRAAEEDGRPTPARHRSPRHHPASRSTATAAPSVVTAPPLGDESRTWSDDAVQHALDGQLIQLAEAVRHLPPNPDRALSSEQLQQERVFLRGLLRTAHRLTGQPVRTEHLRGLHRVVAVVAEYLEIGRGEVRDQQLAEFTGLVSGARPGTEVRVLQAAADQLLTLVADVETDGSTVLDVDTVREAWRTADDQAAARARATTVSGGPPIEPLVGNRFRAGDLPRLRRYRPVSPASSPGPEVPGADPVEVRTRRALRDFLDQDPALDLPDLSGASSPVEQPRTGNFTRNLRSPASGRLTIGSGRVVNGVPPNTAVDVTYFVSDDGSVSSVRVSDPAGRWNVEKDTAIPPEEVARLRSRPARRPAAIDLLVTLVSAELTASETRSHTVTTGRGERATVLPHDVRTLSGWGVGNRVRVDAPVQPDGTLPVLRLTRLDAAGNPVTGPDGEPATRPLAVGWPAGRTADWLTQKARAADRGDPAFVLDVAEIAAERIHTRTTTIPPGEIATVLPNLRRRVPGWGGATVRVDAPVQFDGTLPAVRLTRLDENGIPATAPDGGPVTRAVVVDWSAERTTAWLTRGSAVDPRQVPAALAAEENAVGTTLSRTLTLGRGEQVTVLPREQRRLTGWGVGTRVRVDAPVQPDGTLPVVRVTRLDAAGNPVTGPDGEPVTRALTVGWTAERTTARLGVRVEPAQPAPTDLPGPARAPGGHEPVEAPGARSAAQRETAEAAADPGVREFTRTLRAPASGLLTIARRRKVHGVPPNTAVDVTYLLGADGGVTRVRVGDPVSGWNVEKTTNITPDEVARLRSPSAAAEREAVAQRARRAAHSIPTHTATIGRREQVTVLPLEVRTLAGWGEGTRVRVEAPIQPDGSLPAVILTGLDTEGEPLTGPDGEPLTRPVVVDWSAERTTAWLSERAVSARRRDPAVVLHEAEAAARSVHSRTVTNGRGEFASVLPGEQRRLTGWGVGTRVRVDAPVQPDGSLPVVRMTRLGADEEPVTGPGGEPVSRAFVVDWSAERTTAWLGGQDADTAHRDPDAVLAAAEASAVATRTHTVLFGASHTAAVLTGEKHRLGGWGGSRAQVHAPIQPDGSLPAVRVTRLDEQGHPVTGPDGEPITRAVVVDWSAERTTAWLSERILTVGRRDPATLLGRAEAAAQSTRTRTVALNQEQRAYVLPRERHKLSGWGAGTRVRVDAPIQPDGSLPVVRVTRLGPGDEAVRGEDGEPVFRAVVVDWSAERAAARLRP